MRHRRLACSVLGFLLATAALAQGPRQTILVLDASGSMNARLPSGKARIDAAKEAVVTVSKGLPADLQLALRVYGHQSAREQHDCNDTQLVVPFGPAAQAGSAVVKALPGLAARGYTPITRVLELAAKDLMTQPPGQRSIILVSDGKETCDGDPCATAAALAAANADLVIHAIGFEVDLAARSQLQCIARAGRGIYLDAGDADQLAKALNQAVAAKMAKVAPLGKEPGNLTVNGADVAGHPVIDAASGKTVGTISSLARTLKVAPGVYHVGFGKVFWKSVEVRPKETTVLEPAVLEVAGAGIQGHPVRDSETGAEVAQVSSIQKSVTLIPGVYDVGFGKASWPLVKVDGGKVTTLKPGKLRIEGASFNGHKVRTAGGAEVGEVSNMAATLPLPPGSYTVEIGGKAVPFTVVEGQEVVLKAK
jgi:hypothetical protein